MNFIKFSLILEIFALFLTCIITSCGGNQSEPDKIIERKNEPKNQQRIDTW